MSDPVYRYLRGFALDPGFSTRLDTVGINEVVYKIPFEELEPGPLGEYIDVIDFDPPTDTWYEPVDVGDERIASQHGLAPSEGNPQFHQQFVYAVAMKTIRHFERALGRKIVWRPLVVRPDERSRSQRTARWRREYVRRLRIYPHALRDANAYYDPDKAALLFGYFTAADQVQGANYPGGLVFTCLSPDIVAHETTHAILDSIHDRYIEDTNPDVPAFHEGFADIVALLQRFTFSELVEHQLGASRGEFTGETVFGQLATQFGEALEGNRGALRSMIGRWNEQNEWEPLKPTPADYANAIEAHDRGAVLVATVFDAFQRIYRHRTSDLLRIATAGTGVLPEGNLNPDLVRRLAREAAVIAEHLLHICIRALDYCPPVDISFGDYLRALITADLDIAPEDEGGYRVALIEAFRARGIFPRNLNTLAVESLTWNRPDVTEKEARALEYVVSLLKPHIRALVETRDREELYDRSVEAQEILHGLLVGKRPHFSGNADWERFLNRLGLTSRPVSQLFGRDSAKVQFLLDDRQNRDYIPKIEVHTVRPAFRAGREGRQIEQVLVTLTQKVTVDISEDDTPKPMVFRGGCSIIFSLGDLNHIEYVISKNIKSYDRYLRQVAYLTGDDEHSPAPSQSMYASDDRDWQLNFNLLHRY